MKTRTDIQALRGLAVLLVVLYHANWEFLAAGYLGVDIFFVISGFLITRLVKEGVESGTFRFSEFYFRRAKRLLPAAYVTFLATALIAPLLLDSKELADFAVQMLGAVTFTGNIALWQQTGYFEGAGELKPFLHVWSLAIEEQYYLVLPATLVLVPRRFWLASAVLVLLASLALCVIGVYFKPIATFYLLPTRGWELAVGSVGALIGHDSRLYRLADSLFIPALVAILIIPIFPLRGNHPGLSAIVVCVATLLIILRNHPLANRGPILGMLARVGDFSYSLYLVHWPIFAFASNAWVGDPPGELPVAVRIFAVLLSLLLGYSLYRYVEVPVRRAGFRASVGLVTKTVAASAGLILLTAGLARAASSNEAFVHARRTNFGFGEACEFKVDFVAKPECRNSETPSILVWGDSYAMHLVAGVVATSNQAGVVQATSSQCGPVLDVAPLHQENVPPARTAMNTHWAKQCIAFNRSVLEFLGEADSVQVIVLSSPFTQYLDASQYRSLQRDGAIFTVADAHVDTAIAGLARTVTAIRALGKRVVVVAPPPSGGFDIGRCLERRSLGRLTLGAPWDCEVQLLEYHREKSLVRDFLARVPRDADVEVFEFDSHLCGNVSCKTSFGGTSIYRDSGHFSYAGSRLLAERVSLAGQLSALAR